VRLSGREESQGRREAGGGSRRGDVHHASDWAAQQRRDMHGGWSADARVGGAAVGGPADARVGFSEEDAETCSGRSGGGPADARVGGAGGGGPMDAKVGSSAEAYISPGGATCTRDATNALGICDSSLSLRG